MRYFFCTTVAFLICLEAGLAAEPLDYQQVAKNPKKHLGKTVKFGFRFTRLRQSLAAKITDRGLASDKYIELETPATKRSALWSRSMAATRRCSAL